MREENLILCGIDFEAKAKIRGKSFLFIQLNHWINENGYSNVVLCLTEIDDEIQKDLNFFLDRANISVILADTIMDQIGFAYHHLDVSKPTWISLLNYYDLKLRKEYSDSRCIYNRGTAVHACIPDTESLETYSHIWKREILELKNVISRHLCISYLVTAFLPLSSEEVFSLNNDEDVARLSKHLMNSRSFNSISVDEFGVLCKESSEVKKLKAEYEWYKNFPFKSLVPTAYKFSSEGEKAKIEMEYLPFSTLSEVYVSGRAYNWDEVLKKLFSIQKMTEKCFFENYHKANAIDIKDFTWLYQEKTRSRVEKLKTILPDLMSQDKIIINGIEYENFSSGLAGKVDYAIKHAIDQFSPSVVHGDYCLSNILYHEESGLVKLIDPRGIINGRNTIMGDLKYDLAKLRHSIYGLYDFIVQGLYRFEEKSVNSFEFHIDIKEVHKEAQNSFSRWCEYYFHSSFRETSLKYIEALLFLTMIPLHSDDIKRQKALYCRAVQLFSDIA